MTTNKRPSLVLAGNPNCGKTTIFNLLTGAHQEVGNFPGVTVEYVSGRMKLDGMNVKLVDLPGIYSLSAYSPDETVSRDYLQKHRPDVLVNVIDASMPERQLYLTVQLLELRIPMILVLNMMDVAKRHGVFTDANKLSEQLGTPVVLMNGGTGEGMPQLRQACAQLLKQPLPPKELGYSHELEDVLNLLEPNLKQNILPVRYRALKFLEDGADPEPDSPDSDSARLLAPALLKLKTHSNEDPQTAIAEARYGIVSGILRRCVHYANKNRQGNSERIDAVLCHKILGPILLAGIVYCLFLVIFGIAEDLPWIPMFNGEWVSPVGLLEYAFHTLQTLCEQYIKNPVLLSLVRDGIIAGVGGVLQFVPLIFVMFFCIAFLEDTGYVARVAFIMDRVLRAFGLQGKSILALIVSGGLGGGGCAVPGIMATRTMPEEKDRLVTILVAPMMNCGAKFPLYALMCSAFFVHSRGFMMFLLWVLSWVFGMTAAVLLRKFVVKGEQTPFVMELPVYHFPRLRGLLRHTWSRTWMYVKKAGTIILGISIGLWALMYFPGPENPAQYATMRAEIETLRTEDACTEAEAQRRLILVEEEEAGNRLRNSFAGRLGRLLEPISRIAGFGWKENVALIGGVAAKEIVVGTLSTAYAMDHSPGSQSTMEPLAQKLQSSEDWSRGKAFALMIFVMLYAPCAATLAVIRKETGSTKTALFSLGFSSAFAFVIAAIIYHLSRLF